MAKVFLSAGHGGSDPGAVANGLYEKTINLNTLLACSEELLRHGVNVVCSRTTDVDDPVGQEAREANLPAQTLRFPSTPTLVVETVLKLTIIALTLMVRSSLVFVRST